jgi:hypothetical protein
MVVLGSCCAQAQPYLGFCERGRSWENALLGRPAAIIWSWGVGLSSSVSVWSRMTCLSKRHHQVLDDLRC